MIYAYDEPIVFPTIDLYDSGMMGAYLTAAKDLYDNALKELKDFLDKYGEFISPIENDVNFWYNLGLLPILDTQDAIWNRGGDPLRNPLDRAELSRAMNRIPRATFAKLKLSAAAAEKYLENKAKLESEGKWNPAFEKMILENMGLPDFEHWDTAKNGPWTRVSPGEFKDLNTYTSHIFDDLKDSFIGRTEDGRWLINGVNEKAMRNALTQHLGGIVGSDLGKWYYNQAKNELIAEGNRNPSDDDIMKRLQDNIIVANAERIHGNLEADEFVKQLMSDAAALQRTIAGRSNNSDGPHINNQQGPYLPWDTEVNFGLANAAGISPSQGNPITFGSGIVAKTLNFAEMSKKGGYNVGLKDLLNAYGTSNSADFTVRSGIDTSQKLLTTNYYKATSGIKGQLYTDYDVMGNSLVGQKVGAFNALSSAALSDVHGIVPNNSNTSLLTVPWKDGTVHQLQSVSTCDADGNSNGTAWYDYGSVGQLLYSTLDGLIYNVRKGNVRLANDKDGNVVIQGLSYNPKTKKYNWDNVLVGMDFNLQTAPNRARTNARGYGLDASANSSWPRTGHPYNDNFSGALTK